VIRLSRDPDDTELAFELFRVSSPRMLVDNVERILASRDIDQLTQRPRDLLSVMSDRERLGRCPPGSLGNAYLTFIDERKIATGDLLSVWSKRGEIPTDPDELWYLRRDVVTHDLGHLLLGYDTTPKGETRMAWFNLAQEPSPAWALIASLGLLRYPWSIVSFTRAFLRGRRCRWLITVPLEDYLSAPVSQVARVMLPSKTRTLRPRIVSTLGSRMNWRIFTSGSGARRQLATRPSARIPTSRIGSGRPGADEAHSATLAGMAARS
jgi:ubiquinone biosynthesis protein COQ4